jgi:hypothetical protein
MTADPRPLGKILVSLIRLVKPLLNFARPGRRNPPDRARSSAVAGDAARGWECGGGLLGPGRVGRVVTIIQPMNVS